VELEMPWLARLLRPGSTRPVLLDMQFEVPLFAEGGIVASMATVAARALDGGVIPIPRLAGNSAADRALLARYQPSTARVTITYAIEGANGRSVDSGHALGFWAAPAILCTSREALEPWRYDLQSAAALNHERARLSVEQLSVTTDVAGGGPRRIDATHLSRRLPKLPERTVYIWLDGRARSIPLARREHPSNVICLRIADERDAAPAVVAADPVQGSLAALAKEDGGSSVVRTASTSSAPGLVRLDPPLSRSAYGSPLVSPTGVAGIVLSATAAATIAEVRRAMVQPIPVSYLPPSSTLTSRTRGGADGFRRSPDSLRLPPAARRWR
jgi:hypothetical protein